MLPGRDRFFYLALLILMIFAVFWFADRNRKNTARVESRIDSLETELQQMDTLTRSMTSNLRQTLLLISRVSADLENSRARLETLLLEAGSISSGEKEKIRKAIQELEQTRKSVEEERARAIDLIRELNTNKDDKK